MSASEKLKALERQWQDLHVQATKERSHFYVASVARDSLAALPQIVAVIDIAERIATTDDDVWGTSAGLGFKLQDRLADLDEALS